MASVRTSANRLLKAGQAFARGCPRSAHTAGAGRAGAPRLRVALASAGALGGAYACYHLYNNKTSVVSVPSVYAASVPESQPTVVSQNKDHALYLTIRLKPSADAKICAKSVANLQSYVDQVSPPDMRDEEDEIWAGVGFGPSFLEKVLGKAQQDYRYADRKGPLGAMPAEGGDIFIHAKSNEISKLFELSQAVIGKMPVGSIDNFEDIYSFVYKGGRDLSGFIDGTENPADDESREQLAVEKSTGGSYVITQKWVHNMNTINTEKTATMEGWIGRTLDDSTELRKKSISSHVARMTGGNNFEQKKEFEIVRQSMPYGTLSGKAGLFFIAYAESPENFNFMLDRMVGKGSDSYSDDVMRLTECVASTYWYFPGVNQLKKIA